MASRASSDEGEIQGGNGHVEKAHKSLPQYNGTSVDAPSRNRSSTSTSRSPEYTQRFRDATSRERSRSPYSASRPSKRAREDESTDRSRRDPRTFHVRYEDTTRDYQRRSRPGYDDPDRNAVSNSELQYDDRRYDKRPRTRSRSPYRAPRVDDRSNRGGQARRDDERRGGYERGSSDQNQRPRSHLKGELRDWDRKDQSVSKRGSNPLPTDHKRQEAKSTQGHSQQHNQPSASNLESAKYEIPPLV